MFRRHWPNDMVANSMKKPLAELMKLYSGFSIKTATGNNAFSFEEREHKSIIVPPLIEASLESAELGEQIVFCEIEDGVERALSGLAKFIYSHWRDKHIFLFDNHNHAFMFWLVGLKAGVLAPGQRLIHVDQHSDMREPERSSPAPANWSDLDLKEALDYANFHLNVGNFIRPAIKLGLFNKVDIIDSSGAFQQLPEPPFVFDLDLDIFADEMSYIPQQQKYDYIRYCIKHAEFITIATSPYFIDQEVALHHLRELFETM